MNRTRYANLDTAERIDMLMKQNELSQQKIGKALGVDRKTIASYQNGYSNPSADFIRWICVKTNTSSDWLLGINLKG